jgi:DNA-binding NtrC family response regulator
VSDQEKTILLIDDEPDMVWVLESILHKKGFLTKKVLNGQESLNLIKTNYFSLVFLDAKLPDIEGIELAKLIHNIDPGLPIVMISGYFYLHDEAVQKALADGMICGFIGKPFINVEVTKAIKIVRF